MNSGGENFYAGNITCKSINVTGSSQPTTLNVYDLIASNSVQTNNVYASNIFLGTSLTSYGPVVWNLLPSSGGSEGLIFTGGEITCDYRVSSPYFQSKGNLFTKTLTASTGNNFDAGSDAYQKAVITFSGSSAAFASVSGVISHGIFSTLNSTASISIQIPASANLNLVSYSIGQNSGGSSGDWAYKFTLDGNIGNNTIVVAFTFIENSY